MCNIYFRVMYLNIIYISIKVIYVNKAFVLTKREVCSNTLVTAQPL